MNKKTEDFKCEETVCENRVLKQGEFCEECVKGTSVAASIPIFRRFLYNSK